MVTGTRYLVSIKEVFLVEVNLSLKESKGQESIDLRPQRIMTILFISLYPLCDLHKHEHREGSCFMNNHQQIVNVSIW